MNFRKSRITEHNKYEETDHLYDPLRETLHKSSVSRGKSYGKVSQVERVKSPHQLQGSYVSKKIRDLSPEEAEELERQIYIPAEKRLYPTDHLEKVRGKEFCAIEMQVRQGQPITESEFKRIYQGGDVEETVYEFSESNYSSKASPFIHHDFKNRAQEIRSEQVRIKNAYLESEERRQTDMNINKYNVVGEEIESANVIKYQQRSDYSDEREGKYSKEYRQEESIRNRASLQNRENANRQTYQNRENADRETYQNTQNAYPTETYHNIEINNPRETYHNAQIYEKRDTYQSTENHPRETKQNRETYQNRETTNKFRRSGLSDSQAGKVETNRNKRVTILRGSNARDSQATGSRDEYYQQSSRDSRYVNANQDLDPAMRGTLRKGAEDDDKKSSDYLRSGGDEAKYGRSKSQYKYNLFSSMDEAVNTKCGSFGDNQVIASKPQRPWN